MSRIRPRSLCRLIRTTLRRGGGKPGFAFERLEARAVLTTVTDLSQLPTVVANASPGDTVLIEPGAANASATDTINITKSLTIKGDAGSPVNVGGYRFAVKNTANVTLDNLSINDSAGSETAVSIVDSQNVTIENNALTLSGGSNEGVTLGGATATCSVSISNNTFNFSGGSNLGIVVSAGNSVSTGTSVSLQASGNQLAFTGGSSNEGITTESTGLATINALITGNTLALATTAGSDDFGIHEESVNGSTITTSVSQNTVSGSGSGEFAVDLVSTNTSTIDASVQGNQLHAVSGNGLVLEQVDQSALSSIVECNDLRQNAIGVFLLTDGDTNGTQDLGGGSLKSEGGNNFQDFSAAGTSHGQFAISMIAAGETVSALSDAFGVNDPTTVIEDGTHNGGKGTLIVSNGPPCTDTVTAGTLTAAGTTVAATEGRVFSGAVATFIDTQSEPPGAGQQRRRVEAGTARRTGHFRNRRLNRILRQNGVMVERAIAALGQGRGEGRRGGGEGKERWWGTNPPRPKERNTCNVQRET
jgi:hypothetical protein